MPIDMTAAPPPARVARKATTPRKTTAQKAPENPPMEGSSAVFHARRQGLSGVAQVAQIACMTFGLKADAAAIGMHAGPIVTEMARLAETQPFAARLIDPLIVAGPYAALVSVTLPLIAQLAANHKMGGGFAALGTVPPEVLEARMEAEMMRVELEAMRERQAAMQEAEAARREYADMMDRAQKEMANANASAAL